MNKLVLLASCASVPDSGARGPNKGRDQEAATPTVSRHLMSGVFCGVEPIFNSREPGKGHVRKHSHDGKRHLVLIKVP